MTRLLFTILELSTRGDISITFENVMEYIAVLIGGLVVFQLQRIITKFNTLIMDVELGKKDHAQTKERLVELSVRVDGVHIKIEEIQEKQTEHEIRIRDIEP